MLGPAAPGEAGALKRTPARSVRGADHCIFGDMQGWTRTNVRSASTGEPRTGRRACAGCGARSRLIRILSTWQRTCGWPDGVPNSALIATFVTTIAPRL
ncbi:hypothetical protein [Burkholderia sp. BE17]|uniref:hypothetical protein n=1 Tax=Burkholderia sp. BE17 TaxID=2656644 RepID=UPI00128D5540|nr:hypothetical protein [Burkholderia sp. BE17]MPV69285.1 hypothetical protein [Burkholderia sp. BE17]